MKRFLFICFFAFCLVFPALAETSLLHEVEQSYQNMKNFKAEFKQELFHRESNTTQTRTGTLEFMPKMFIFWETNAPNRELIVCNDKEVWNYLP
ncbi:MAG: outer membrane lipoprotein carrier protein LolA, partial [Mailhella sp.]|nr:outer membrane lipoprotein carrier protein LolA [Mailhella sp.]